VSGRGRDGPGVTQLHRHRSTFGVDDFGQVGQSRCGLVGQHDLVGCAAAVGRNGAERDRGHADAAPCDRPMELDQPLAHDVFGGGALERRRLDDAIP
jgi:hypothetical protein